MIFHIDYDSFFASVEQQDNPKLRGRPIGVTGSSLSRGVVCAASKEAKKFGVRTAMPLFKARQICPQIIPVRGNFSRYQEIHNTTLQILNNYTDLIEPFSIDEFFIDMTQTLKFFGNAENAIAKLKSEVLREFGEVITISVGVAPNKLLAKLASDINKPDGVFMINRQNVKSVLRSTPLRAFCGIGGQIEKRLNKIGVLNIPDLQRISMDQLYYEFGNVESRFLKNLSFGIDDSPVAHVEYEEVPKSIGHQHTLDRNTSDPEVIRRNIQRLSDMVGRRLRRHEMVGRTVSLSLRDSDFRGYHERKTVNPATDSSQRIYEVAAGIFNEIGWAKETRLVGVAIGNLELKAQTPLPLFTKDLKEERVNEAMDTVNDRFGEFTIVPANTLLADETKGKISSFLRH